MPANDRAPSFQFYPRDFLADPAVEMMTPEELGGYFRLLCHAWESDGVLDDDDHTLALLSRLGHDRWGECAPAIRRAFKLKDGKLIQARMVQERAAQKRRHEQARKGGLITASKARASRAQQAKGFQLSTSTAPTPASASASASTSKHLRLSGASTPFDDFWKAWPKGKKKSKIDARKVWKSIKAEQAMLFVRIMRGLAAAKASQEWAKDDGQFIPYPAKWLRAGGWDDEYTPLASSVNAGPSFMDQARAIIQDSSKGVREKAAIETLVAQIHKNHPGFSPQHAVQIAVNHRVRKLIP